MLVNLIKFAYESGEAVIPLVPPISFNQKDTEITFPLKNNSPYNRMNSIWSLNLISFSDGSDPVIKKIDVTNIKIQGGIFSARIVKIENPTVI